MSENYGSIGALYYNTARAFSRDPYPSVVAACYVTGEAYGHRRVDIPDLDEFLQEIEAPDLIRGFVLDKLESHWDDWRKLLRRFDPDEVTSFCIETWYDRDDYRSTTPPSIAKLATRLLDIRPSDFFADFGSGIGEVLNCAYLEQLIKCKEVEQETNNPNCRSWLIVDEGYKARGIEVNREQAAISAIKTYLLSRKTDGIRIADVFEFDPSETYNKIFCRPPWGLRSWKMLSAKRFLAKHYSSLSDDAAQCSGEWLFALRAMTSLAEGGRAVIAAPNGTLFNSSDEPIRRYFLERGWIQAIVTLPERCFSDTGISASLLVLSRGNECVRFVDAMDCGVVGRWLRTFSDEDIDAIVAATVGSSRAGKRHRTLRTIDRSVKQILAGTAILSPARILRRPPKIEHGTTLGAVSTEVIRGASLRAETLASLMTKTPTSFRYMSVKDIQDGRISENLPFLVEVPERQQSHCVRDGDLIVTKTGKPFKAAVVRVPAGTTILIGGNLLAVSIDRNKADPDYVAAFLSSERGLERLLARSVGSALPTIGPRELETLEIPCPSMERQAKMAQLYRAKLDEIAHLKKRIARIRDEISLLGESESEG